MMETTRGQGTGHPQPLYHVPGPPFASPCSSATITVTVADVNDHTPQFSQSDYMLSISEATLRNTRFPILEVSDLDSEENGRLTFTADITC